MGREKKGRLIPSQFSDDVKITLDLDRKTCEAMDGDFSATTGRCTIYRHATPPLKKQKRKSTSH